MKYKPGDRVKIRADLRPGEDYGGLKPVLSMCMKRGNVATIKSSEVYNCMLLYHIEGDGCDFLWTEEMFEKIEDKEKVDAVMKYKVGDKVRIRHDLHESSNWCGALVDVTKDMLKRAGKVVTISKVRDNNSYRIREDGGTYLWHESMIQGKVIPIRCEPKEAPKDAANDPVSHPSHYTDGKIEVIDFIEDKKLGYHLGNACKYISRCQLKYGGKKRIEDLEKAIWYIKRQIEVWRQDDKQKAEQSR